ncbi:MAG: MotA/TolQ/ExbB proton channel family protein [Pseudomonadota bacterium]
MLEFFHKGGPVMFVLLGLSIYGVAVIIFKIYQFWNAGMFDRDSYIEKAVHEIRGGDIVKASTTLSGVRGPIARIMRVALDCVANREISQKSKEAEIARVGAADIRYLESHLRGLEMIANIGPLLGLLGTVMGMVTAFAKLESAGSRIDPSLFAGGIWEAFICTVAGLIVAIPAIGAYYAIDALIERVRSTMRDVSIQILALEDEFKRNEKELKRKEAAKREIEMREIEERVKNAASNQSSTPENSSTLKMLSPRYVG